MAEAQATENNRGANLANELGISNEHCDDMEAVMSYMEKNRIPELFNEILTRILDERPPDAKQHIIEYLKTAHKAPLDDPNSRKLYQFQDQEGNIDTFLTQEDFESIFDSYDVLNIQSVPISYLV